MVALKISEKRSKNQISNLFSIGYEKEKQFERVKQWENSFETSLRFFTRPS